MKIKLHSLFIVLAYFAGIHQIAAQGTAFTYQGKLDTNGSPATGSFDFQFKLFPDPLGNLPQVGTTFLTNGIPVAGGLFTVGVDFGAGIFTGSNYWLLVGVRTNGGTSYNDLSPLQPVTPTPYSIMANSASNLLGGLPTSDLNGTVGNAQLANSSVTVAAGTGLSGGGTVALGGSTTLSNAGVLSVTGNSDITANTMSGAVTLGDTATSAATPNTLVKRDATGSFSATNLTLNGSLTLPAIAAGSTNLIFSGTTLLLYANSLGNFFSGPGAGNRAVTGGANTAYGSSALQSLSGAGFNTAIGDNALLNNTSGNNNTAAGSGAIFGNKTGFDNTAVGFDALLNMQGGSNNIALGFQAGSGFTGNESSNIDIGSLGTVGDTNIIRIGSSQTNTLIAGVINGNGAGLTNLNAAQLVSGAIPLVLHADNNSNFFSGPDAGNLATTGFYNTANGSQVLSSNTSGSFNAASGNQALEFNTSGSENTAIGAETLEFNTNGSDNTAVGTSALGDNNSGSKNTAIGAGALGSLGGAFTTGGTSNIAVGYQAGNNLTGNQSSNIDIGSPGNSTDNNIIRIGSTQTSTFITGVINGNGSGLTNLNASQLTSGAIPLVLYSDNNSNFFSGPDAGNLATTGFYNTANGSQVLSSNTSGSFNAASGNQALEFNTSGSENTAIGAETLEFNTNGSDNTAVGTSALGDNNSGSKNTAIGAGALGSLGGAFTTGGTSNIAVGYQAGNNLTGNQSSNIDIGSPGNSTDNNIIRIGSTQTSTFIAGVINGNGAGLTNINPENLSAGAALLASNQTFTATNIFSKPVGIATTATPEALLEIQGGADNTGANDQHDISLEYRTGGYRHWIRTRHNTSLVDNAIDFYVNSSGTAGGSVGPTNGSVLVMSLNGGNVGIGMAEPTHLLVVGPSASPAFCDGTTWQNGSDRNSKEAFTAIDPRVVLEKVSALPITEWKYKVEADGTKHIGPMAQDFHAAFGLNGGDDKHIATIDEEGVALAAIQGLNQKLDQKDAEIQTLKQQNDSLARELDELKAAVKSLAERK